MRRIFSTVLGAHDPALTVGSLAMTATGRPSTWPEPGDHALGALAVLLPAGQQPLLAERALVEQQADPLAHRQLALLGRLAPDGARGRPAEPAPAPRAATSRGRAHAGHSTGPAVSTWLPSGRPRTAWAAREASMQRRQVDAGLDAHLVQHRDEILGGDVAGGPRRDRAAAELAEARLEALHPGLQRGQHVGQALAAGVVEVGGQLDARQASSRRRRTRAPAAGWPSRWCRRSRSPRRPPRPARRRARAPGRPARGPRRDSRTRSR